jgi:hypothetical protein
MLSWLDWLIPEEFAETIRIEFLNGGFKIYHQSADVLQFGTKAEVNFIIARRPISRKMIEDAHYSQELQLPVVLIEDLIGLKIQAYAGNSKRQFKELSDIQELGCRHPEVNWEKIKFYADHFQKWEEIQSLKVGS